MIILSSTVFRQSPVAVIDAVPNPTAVGFPVTFDAIDFFHQDSFFDIEEYLWDFDASDGINFDTPDAVGPIVTNAYGMVTNYIVTLRVKDNNIPPLFDTANVQIDVTLPPHPPTADAGGPYVAAVGERIVLDGSGFFDVDQSLGDSIQAWDWEIDFEQPLDFDDTVHGERAEVIGAFYEPSVKNIGLRVTDNTVAAFLGSGSPDLTDDDFTTAIIYNLLVDDHERLRDLSRLRYRIQQRLLLPDLQL